MRCKKCGRFATQETVPAEQDIDINLEYKAYIHVEDNGGRCVCTEVDSGTYDAEEPIFQMYAIDFAMRQYFKDGIVADHTWLSVQQHDLGKGSCKCSQCVAVCQICSMRRRAIESE